MFISLNAFHGGGIKELITILSYHPERAITSKYIADTLSILKITASLCHQRWHQKVKFRPLAHGLIGAFTHCGMFSTACPLLHRLLHQYFVRYCCNVE